MGVLLFLLLPVFSVQRGAESIQPSRIDKGCSARSMWCDFNPVHVHMLQVEYLWESLSGWTGISDKSSHNKDLSISAPVLQSLVKAIL